MREEWEKIVYFCGLYVFGERGEIWSDDIYIRV